MAFRIFISSVQDEFTEERRRLKAWLTTDLFVSRFVESVFLFEDVPSRSQPPQDVFLDEAKASDIYIGLIGSQYYGKASAKRGLSATEREYDAAGAGDGERWVYLKAVEKREPKTAAFVSRVNRDVARTVFATFEDLKSAVYSSFVSFLDRRELIDVGDFDKSVCREMTTADLNALVKAGVVKRVGAGRGATYVLQKCTINAQNAQRSVKPDKTTINKGLLSSHDPIKAHVETVNETVNEIVNETVKDRLIALISRNPGVGSAELVKAVGKSRATVMRALAVLRQNGIVEHRGSNKTGGYFPVATEKPSAERAGGGK